MKDLVEPALEFFKVWLEHRFARAANTLLLGGLALLAAPWWQPLVQTYAAKTLGIDASAFSTFDNAAAITGWILLSIGVALHLINRFSPRPEKQKIEVSAHWWQRCKEDGLAEHPDMFLTVLNKGTANLPWLNVHVFPSNSFQLDPTQDRTDRILSSQYAVYRFNVVDETGALTDDARRFLRLPATELSIRIFKDRSPDDALLISYDLGLELHNHLSKIAGGTT